ncbi:hypothetical protein PHMEG_00014247 [Phytophthora megakarya]|uniref:M96 mating-specific protein n=1 Tax=Phytophthora megakarya TaxID=4795 RepID=A0A225W4R7_9STRA|nr:hypothetical protein PHMEG_00014247 [Phytophthora megakarya]
MVSKSKREGSCSESSSVELGRRHNHHHGAKRRDPHVASVGLTKSGNKKRVRRIQRELPILRQQVQELELKLTRLQFQNTSSNGNLANKQNQVTQKGFLWNLIAERQLKERLRVEQQQIGLKDLCKELRQYSSELQILFTKFEDYQEVTFNRSNQQRKTWKFEVHDDEEIFADQMMIIAKLYLTIQMQYQKPDRTMHFGQELAMGKDIPRLDPTAPAGIVFDARCGILLPFTLDVAVEAYWKFFRCDHLDQFNGDNEPDNDIVTRSFSIRANLKGCNSEAHGKYMCQKYASEDGVALIWSGVWYITEYGGVKFQGMQLHKRGSVKLRCVPREGPGQQSTSTVVEALFETIPVFEDNVIDRMHQTESLRHALNRSFNIMNSTFCQMMSGLLLKEDWKATFGRENVSC